MSSTAFRPVFYMICVHLVKSAFPACFVFTHFNLPSWDFKSVVTGRWYRQIKRHACTESIFVSNHLWTSLCSSEPMEWNGPGIATIYGLFEFQQLWLMLSMLTKLRMLSKLSMLRMFGNSGAGCSVQHMWNRLNMVSMLGHSRTGCSAHQMWNTLNMVSIWCNSKTGCSVHQMWSMLSSTWTRYNVTVAWRARTLLPHPTPKVAWRSDKRKNTQKLPGYFSARLQKQPPQKKNKQTRDQPRAKAVDCWNVEPNSLGNRWNPEGKDVSTCMKVGYGLSLNFQVKCGLLTFSSLK